jgi:hypothetical protein
VTSGIRWIMRTAGEYGVPLSLIAIVQRELTEQRDWHGVRPIALLLRLGVMKFCSAVISLRWKKSLTFWMIGGGKPDIAGTAVETEFVHESSTAASRG